MHSMQNPFKIILSILGLLLFFSCEQHYYFLNKVKVNTDEIALKTVKHFPQQSLNISINADSNNVVNKNINVNNELAKTDFRIDTLNLYLIKKTLTIEGENLNKTEIKKPYIKNSIRISEKGNSIITTVRGVLLILVFFCFLMSAVFYSQSTYDKETGCLAFMFGWAGLVLIIPCMILFII